MLYDYILENYKEAEPIFFSDLERDDISKSALNQQLKTMCKNGFLEKYDTGVYYRPKKSLLKSSIGPNADMVARYRFISKGENVYVLQILELLKNLDDYLDGSYQEAKEKFTEYIKLHGITRKDIDMYIRDYPGTVFRYYYELELDHVLA